MDNTWILIANSERARCFERSQPDHTLTELADFTHVRAALGGQSASTDLNGAAGKGHGRTGHAGTQFEPHTDAHAKERRQFAHELASYLNTAVDEHRCHRLVMIASSPMLGELTPLLHSTTEKIVQTRVASDLTTYQGPDLVARVNRALELPA
jgi:protein required for attachment to host cells